MDMLLTDVSLLQYASSENVFAQHRRPCSDVGLTQDGLNIFDEASTQDAIAQADRLVMRRWKANARERKRMQRTKAAFTSLRETLPAQADECHLTRMDVLCRAMEYIRCLERETHGDGPNRPPLLTIDRPSTTSTPKENMAILSEKCETKSMPHAQRRQRRDSGYSESSWLSDNISAWSDNSTYLLSAEDLPRQVETVTKRIDVGAQPTSDYDSDCTSSSSSSNLSSLQVRRRMPASRITVNRQLRARSKRMQDAFQDLRDVVPVDPNSPHLCKAKFLRQASMYIAHLQSLLSESA